MGKTIKLNFKKWLIFEGGAIRGDSGEISTPISTVNRWEVVKDLNSSLGNLHDTHLQKFGAHLFGKNQAALKTGSAYSGSSKHLVDKSISDEELTKYKPMMGDIDTQVPKERMKDLDSHLQHGTKFGKYTVVGKKKHGQELSILAKHENGEHHQIDFEGVDYKHDEPSKEEQFAHSSNWNDTKHGIKGANHKMLLNAAGGETHKFSITHGLKSRDDLSKVTGIRDPEGIKLGLFGKNAAHDVDSFDGVAKNIRDHIPSSKHDSIISKFSERGAPNAIARLKDILSGKLNENTDEHHAHITFMGASPSTHMGHIKDIILPMLKTGDSHYVGLSGKSTVFSPSERTKITQEQAGANVQVNNDKTIGETVGRAWETAKKSGKSNKILHIHLGHDRKTFAENFKASLEMGKIKEMNGDKWDEVHIHYPDDQNRNHGMSGTKFRKAAFQHDTATVKKHLGPAYTPIRDAKIREYFKSHPEELIRK